MKLLGRNAPCWCESGKKYKHCHLDIGRQPPIAAHTVLQALGSFKKNKKCSVPQSLAHECSGGIINAHTVSKSSSLKEIARNGHVLKISLPQKINIAPKTQITEEGINSASTFSGFCAAHDKKLFSPVEDQPFKPVPLHCFLITYRGISKEIFSKEYASKTYDFMKTLDRGRSLPQQIAIQKAAALLGKNNSLTENDLKHIKSKLDAMLLSGDYTDLHYVVFTLESPPPIMGSAIFGPTFDFEGNKAQKSSSVANDMPDYMAINAFASEGKGYIVLSWLSEHAKTCSKLVKQFIDKKLTADSLAAFMILLIENIYISPDWWESLDKNTQALIKDMCSQGVETDTVGNSINFNHPLHFPAIINVSMNPTI
jgi:hypothetical protein